MGRMRGKDADLFKWEAKAFKLEREEITGGEAVQGPAISSADLRFGVLFSSNYGEELGAVSAEADPVFKRGSGFSPEEEEEVNTGVNFGNMEARIQDLHMYFMGPKLLCFHPTMVFVSITFSSSSFLCCLLHMAGQGENKGQKGSGVDGKAEALAGSLMPAEGQSAKRLECPATPALGRGRSAVGGPLGLALTTTPLPLVGFSAV
ncbi:hypothetical protein ZWY2020_042793 [Hordeum vulgare]|nr:hypothetical protein ZWY2020_042793 [Hordeum vulgare]